MLNVLLQTATEAGAKGSGNILMTVVPFILIFVVFYFFLIRPQNKKQKETQQMIAALKKGDKVVTIGGIHGTVTSTREETVVIRVDDNCKIEISKSAVSTVLVDKPANAPATEEKKGVFASLFGKKNKAAKEEKTAEKVESKEEPKVEEVKAEEAKTEAPVAEEKTTEENK